ncbi:hypothetical protein [Paraburkholderia sp. MM5482-R1]
MSQLVSRNDPYGSSIYVGTEAFAISKVMRIGQTIDFQSPDYQRALHALEKSYFGKENRPNMPIASIGASLGAELLIEFDTVDVVTDLL